MSQILSQPARAKLVYKRWTLSNFQIDFGRPGFIVSQTLCAKRMTTPELLFQRLQELGAGEFAHLNGSLIEHLKGTADLLKSWGNREALCNAGLYHAVYGTDGYDESLVGLTMRQQIAGFIGTEAEGITYLYGACDRKAFYPRIGTSSQLTYSDRFTQKSFEIPQTTLKDLCELILANELEIAKNSEPFRKEYGAQLSQLFEQMRGLVSDHGFRFYKEVLG